MLRLHILLQTDEEGTIMFSCLWNGKVHVHCDVECILPSKGSCPTQMLPTVLSKITKVGLTGSLKGPSSISSEAKTKDCLIIFKPGKKVATA